MVGERSARNCGWGGLFSSNDPVIHTGAKLNSPAMIEWNTPFPGQFWNQCGASSYHVGGAHMMTADGAVHFINENIDHRLYCALGDKSDGIVASLP